MCGIVGVIGALENKNSLLQQACERIKQRGPDSQGVWLSQDETVGFAHVRLAIQDLSVHGHQPMFSDSDRFVIVFNGEIYNHLQLRNELGKDSWRGHSDTETLLACIESWGVDATLKKLVGMFAFALWDKQQETLTLARDRFGEKPLYFAKGENGGLFFASDLKAIMPMEGFSKKINRHAAALLLRHNYIPAPYTIFETTQKLLPAHYIVFTKQQLETGMDWPSATNYWSAYEHAKRTSDRVFTNDNSAVDAFEIELSRAVKGQMLADVPLGAFLSGGTDSSLIVAMMQKQSATPINTFSIGFEEPQYNEAEYAKAVAKHLGTYHTELYMNANDALNMVSELPQAYSEPFADSSQLPVLTMMKLTSQHVKVALSGDAGDELFGGYNRYKRAQKWWNYYEKLPYFLHKPLAKTARILADKTSDISHRAKLEQSVQLLQAENAVEFYQPFVSYWKHPEQLVLGAKEPVTAFSLSALRSLKESMMIVDTLSYLPDDILVKVDRAAMYYSLETRVPLLDHQLFEFVWDIHWKYKERDGQQKWLMKELLYRYVPKALLDRPKKGFSVPLGEWLRGPLREWANQLLDNRRLQQQGLLNSDIIQQTWQAHLNKKGDWSAHLWGILMLQAWIDAYAIEV
ncbi:asparagine synthase [Pelistega indica]|uniref:asparagine synthase (glutamine-hydrolyzing) n=1 Tax=Pelistega indica TaxID=1414851 RepID=V8G6V1_9BURK|nr:asparagine synthase (glutamine-hydrolyzing) [Pelistega indica]ETD72264.1 asparagine synthase [Pelistega indica]